MVYIKAFEPESHTSWLHIFYSNVTPGIASCPPIIRGLEPEKSLGFQFSALKEGLLKYSDIFFFTKNSLMQVIPSMPSTFVLIRILAMPPKFLYFSKAHYIFFCLDGLRVKFKNSSCSLFHFQYLNCR